MHIETRINSVAPVELLWREIPGEFGLRESRSGDKELVDHKVMELMEIARKRTRASREQLLENITDMFLTDEGRLNEHERALMSDILSKLIGEVEASLRIQLSEVIARSEVQLPEVVKLLANDDIEIARPLLQSSKLLKDPDLVEIIRMRTDEHRLVIAIRDEVGEDVTDALVEYGSHDVIEALLKNSDANLSQRAMEYLVAESRRVDRFQEPLLNRDELPSELAYRMYWWVSAALRKRIITEYKVDPVQVDDMMRQATQQALVDQSEGDGAVVRAQKLVRRMSENGELTHRFLLQSLRQQRIPVFIAGIGHLANVDYKTAWHVVNDRSGDSVAVLAKAIGVDRNDFSSLYLLLTRARDGVETASPGVLKQILDLFDAVTLETAQGAVQFWQQEKVYQIAMDELEHA